MNTIVTGQKGRERLAIDKDRLEYLLAAGFTVSKIARDGLLGGKVHRNTINNFIKDEGMLLPRQRYATVTTEELQEIVRIKHNQFPNFGYRDIQNILVSEGLR